MAFETTRQEILKQAIELKKLYDSTRIQKYKNEELRLRRIAVELSTLSLGGAVTQIIAGTNVTVSPAGGTGAVTINATADMLKSVYDIDNDGVVDAAERTEIIVRNSTGSTLTKGTVVYLSGATGNRPNAVRSQANAEPTSSKTIGIVEADIPNNSDGYVATNGTLHNLDTSAFAAGDALWLSPTTAGGWTTTIPSEPDHSVFIGYVARSHPTQGRVVILIKNGYELNELHDVYVPSPSNGDLLQWDATNAYWKNVSPASVGSLFKIDYDPDITGVKNGTNKIFTTSSNFVSTTTRVFWNGLRLTRGATYDYTETGANQITLAVAPTATDLLIIEYQI